MNNQERIATARGRAALDVYEAAVSSGSPSLIGSARVELESSRRQLELVKAESAVFDRMKQAMSKGHAPSANSLALRKAAAGRRPGLGSIPFSGRRSV